MKTFTDYEALVSHYISPHLGKKRLNTLSVGDVRTFLRKVSTQPGRQGKLLSPRTVRYIHAVLRSALQHAVREELVGRNVAKLVSPPSTTEHEVAPLKPHDARRLIEHAQQHWLCALWLIYLYLATGLR